MAFNPIKIVSHRGVYFVEAMQHGRYCYTGRVEASDGAPVIAATVMALTPDDHIVITYGLTDSEGRFSIPCDRTSILLKISALGYRTDTITPTSFNLGNIRLATDAIALANVTVTARNISRVDDHLEIIPDKNQLKHAATGYQLLRNLMLPGMDVDPFNGSVTLFGQNVSLYIDGAPATALIVQNLRPKDIEKIEYHDSPTGRYASDFAAINFITRKRTTGGYVTLSAQQCIGGYLSGNYNGFSKINRGNTNVYLFGGYNVQNAANDWSLKNESFNLDSRSTIERDYTSTGGRDRIYGRNGGVQIVNMKQGRYVSLNAALVSSNSVTTTSGSTAYSEPITLNENTESRTANSGLSPRLSYYGQFAMREKDLLVTSLNASYSDNKYNYLYTNGKSSVTSDTKEDFYSFSADLSYKIDFGHRNTLELIALDLFKVTSTNYLGTFYSWQHMWNSEALFMAQYEHRITPKVHFYARPGLSIVSTGLHGFDHENVYSPRLWTQTIYNPTKKQQLTFNLAIGNSTPSLSTRTAAEQAVDLIISRRGNPTLKFPKLYQTDIRYSLQARNVNLSSFASFKFYKDVVITNYTPEENRLIIGYNNGNYKEALLMPGISWKVSDGLRLQANASMSHSEIITSDGKLIQNTAEGTISMMYFWRKFSFNLKGNTTSRRLNMSQTHSFNPMGAELSIGWTSGNWRLDAWTRTSSRLKRRQYIDVAPYRMTLTSHGRFYGMVKVAYTFDFGKKVQREQRQADTSIESAILK